VARELKEKNNKKDSEGLRKILEDLIKPSKDKEEEIYRFHKKISSVDESLESVIISV
jgi:hypothetical protein